MANDPKEEGFVERRKPGRPLGSKTKKPDPPQERVRLRDIVERALTPQARERLLKQLTPDQTARLLASLEPKEKMEPAGNTFTLIVSGLGNLPFPVSCPECRHEFMASRPAPQPAPPGGTISTPATPEADRSGGPKEYVPDEGALKRLQQAREADIPGTWYEGPDDFDPDKET